MPALDESTPGEAIDELNRRMMLNLEPLGQRTDRHGPPALQPLDLEQEEILLGLHARAPSRHLASPEEPSNLVAQVGKRAVIDP